VRYESSSIFYVCVRVVWFVVKKKKSKFQICVPGFKACVLFWVHPSEGGMGDLREIESENAHHKKPNLGCGQNDTPLIGDCDLLSRDLIFKQKWVKMIPR
jgi:hypothetical protein